MREHPGAGEPPPEEQLPQPRTCLATRYGLDSGQLGRVAHGRAGRQPATSPAATPGYHYRRRGPTSAPARQPTGVGMAAPPSLLGAAMTPW